MIYDVRHVTRIRYTPTVRLARFNLRLKPATWPGQTLLDYQLTIDPAPAAIVEDAGPWVVNRARLSIAKPISRLEIETRFRVEVINPGFALDINEGPTIAHLREAAMARRDISSVSPASYLYPSPIADSQSEIADWAAPFLPANGRVMACASALMAAIHTQFRYDGNATRAETPPIVAFRQRSGVCQDFAHIMVIAARAHGIPAAYVSGYLRTRPPAGQPRLVGADAMHAWAAIWCGEELGWVGFDPTNDVLARADHIFIAMGRDFGDVSPLDGVFVGGGEQAMDIAVDVIPIE